MSDKTPNGTEPRARIANGWCALCGHWWEAHVTGRCDVEILDYGDWDCGCEGAFKVDFHPLPVAATGNSVASEKVL